MSIVSIYCDRMYTICGLLFWLL